MTKYRLTIFSQAGMVFGVLVIFCGTVLAHDPGLSAADIRILPDKIIAEVSFAPLDLDRIQPVDSNGDGVVSDQELKTAAPQLAVVAHKLLDIQLGHRKIDLQTFSVEVRDRSSVHFLLEFPNENAGELRIVALVLMDLPRGHKQFISVRDKADKILIERMLSADSGEFTIDLRSAPASAGESIPRFLLLGIEHILTGYDHLAFLLAVLLTGGSIRSNAKIITSFTVAHSITLALATLGLVSIPSGVVEPLIAVSIVFVGIENLVRRRLTARWLVTFGFGLIHGLGFASVLRDLGIGATGARAAALPLLSFNLGVEIAQVAIAVLVLPVIWNLQRRPAFALKHAPALSLLITLAGGYWFLVRMLT